MDILMEKWKNEYLEKDTTYKAQIEKFVFFLSLPQINLGNAPAKITISDLNNFITYYVKNEVIKSANTLKSYLEAVKSFYRFLIINGYVSTQIVPIEKYSVYISEQIEKHHLKNAASREWLDNDTIKSILKHLDFYFENTDYDSLTGNQESKRYIDRLALRIYIKICLIAPAKRSCIYNLTFLSISTDYSTITVNNVNLNIPYGLRHNLIHMLKFISNEFTLVPKPNEKIFSFINRALDSKDTSERINYCFASFLKEYNIIDIPSGCLTYPVEVIANTTIFNLVADGTNPSFIAQITGISISSLEKKYYASLSNYEFIKNYCVDDIINRNLSNCNYYHYI